jgi:Putative peptidoglycan binding domain
MNIGIIGTGKMGAALGNRCRRATLRAGARSEICTSAACLLLVALIAICGCTRDQSMQKKPTEAPQAQQQPEQTAPPSPQPRELNEVSTPGPQSLEGSGEVAWAKAFRGQLIAGLDGELYEPYRSVTIERIQRAIKERGLYAGPINGILDTPTMKAIYTFQQANHNLQVCGVPTPRTRKMLEQGSHTDLAS